MNADLEVFHAGITPASGEYLRDLEAIQSLAADMIKTAELEKAGFCDGDGTWHGGDPLAGIAAYIVEAVERRKGNKTGECI